MTWISKKIDMKVDELDDYICNTFIDENSDLLDLASIVEDITKKIYWNLENNKENKENKEKIHEYLMKKRLYAKMMLMSKARSGHDFYFPEEKPLCRFEEIPYSFKNAEKCKEQYNQFINTLWNPSFLKIQNMEI